MNLKTLIEQVQYNINNAKPLTTSQIEGINLICGTFRDNKVDELAYALATAWWETNRTMQPVREAYWLDEDERDAYYLKHYDVAGRRPATARKYGNTQPGDGKKYYGRGYVQLTWKNNYRAASKALGVDLVAEPDKALDPAIAVRIMHWGMVNGAFTGKSFQNCRNENGELNFYKARSIINGKDKAEELQELGWKFQSCIIQARKAALEPERQIPVVAVGATQPKPKTGIVGMLRNWFRKGS